EVLDADVPRFDGAALGDGAAVGADGVERVGGRLVDGDGGGALGGHLYPVDGDARGAGDVPFEGGGLAGERGAAVGAEVRGRRRIGGGEGDLARVDDAAAGVEGFERDLGGGGREGVGAARGEVGVERLAVEADAARAARDPGDARLARRARGGGGGEAGDRAFAFERDGHAGLGAVELAATLVGEVERVRAARVGLDDGGAAGGDVEAAGLQRERVQGLVERGRDLPREPDLVAGLDAGGVGREALDAHRVDGDGDAAGRLLPAGVARLERVRGGAGGGHTHVAGG